MSEPDAATAIAALRERVLSQPCADGRRPVFGAGSLSPVLAIVGEGPAERDETTGRPFSGPAGALLTRALAEAGIDQEQVWLTNVLKCRVVTQRDGRWVNRPPTDAELAAAMPVLDEELG